MPSPRYVAGGARILDDFAKDDDVRVVVLTGAGGKPRVGRGHFRKLEDERNP
jgi:hypothetical protein